MEEDLLTSSSNKENLYILIRHTSSHPLSRPRLEQSVLRNSRHHADASGSVETPASVRRLPKANRNTNTFGK